MTEQDREITPPDVGQMYRQGLHLTARAIELVGNGLHPAVAQEAATCAATAQACFAGVQAAAHAVLALGIVSEIEDDLLPQSTQRVALVSWRGVVEMSGGQ